MRTARLCLALSFLLLAPAGTVALQPGPGTYRVDWLSAPFTVPMWLVQCTGTCPSDGLFLVSNPQAIPAGAVRILGGPYNNGGDLFLDRQRLLQVGLPPQALRVEVLDAGGQRVDGLILAEPAELGRRTAELLARADTPRAPARRAPQTNAAPRTADDDDVIRAITPSEAGRAAGPLAVGDDDDAIIAMTPSEASRVAEAQARVAGPPAAGQGDQSRPIRSMTFSEASRVAEAQARAAIPAQWDTRIRIHGIECFGGQHIPVYTDHYHLNGRFVSVDRRDYDQARATALATGAQFCGAWETGRETVNRGAPPPRRPPPL